MARGLIYTLAFILLLLAADAAFVVWQVRSNLTSASKVLVSGSEKLRSGDPVAAMPDLKAALQQTASAEDALRHPSARLAEAFPLTSNDLNAVGELAATAATAARSGSAISQVLTELGVTRGDISTAFYENGEVNVHSLETAAPRISEATRAIFLASSRLEAVEQIPRLQVIADALNTAKLQLASASAATEQAEMLFDLLPSALGGTADRRYLLLFQALGESRATGGVVGLYGIVTATDGQLALQSIHPYTKLKKIEATDVPAWFEKNYSFQSALTQWPQANVSPNFPAVAQVMLSMYENSSREQLDGVLAMDPLALSTLMQGTGPIQVGRKIITPDEMDELLLVRSYTDFPDQESQNDFLARVVRAFWDELSATPEDPEGIIKGFGEAITQQHLKFYLADEEEQLALSELKADGSYTSAGDMVQMLFTNNYSTNKVDYFLNRSTKTDVLILPDGTARVDVSVVLRNDSPRGFPDLLLGAGTSTLAPGGNASLVSLLMPIGAQAVSTSVDRNETAVLTYQDEDHPVSWAFVDIPPQEETRLRFSYELPGAVDLAGGGAFSLTLFPQAVVNAEQYEVRVAASSFADGKSIRESEIIKKGTLTTPALVEVAFASPGR
ncbi:MAG: DUF4012 domain-containing protein [Actinobacteria bacterium]|nr:DUF4012 domain-containing protein [Actinomycetota bacterium]